jgi:DNA repair exonuclease SbcCD ATPase subunit
LRTAEAKLDAAAPHLRVERLGKNKILVDGQDVDEARTVVERRIESETLIEVADHARIAITPGGDLHEMRAAVGQHREDADRLLKLIGATDWASAAEANRKLKNAQRQVDEVARVEQDKLRDLTYDSLVDRIRDVEARFKEYAKRRQSELAAPADFDAARALLADAQADAAKAREAEEDAERSLGEVRTRCQELEKARADLNTKTEVLQTQAETAAKNLEEARGEHTDAINALEELEENLQQRQKAWKETKKVLSANDPESTKAKLDNAKDVLNAHGARLRQLEHSLTEVKARIEVHEEDGLFEDCQRLETELQAARRRAISMRRRAEAARIVFELFSEERDAARQAYVRPLQNAIERLGRIIHGDSFKIKVGEDLSVTHRTLDGRTLEFTQLSAGAKEQLGILTRVACTILVAKDGGIPLILDDTLGNTDPERLEAMGAVLHRAGRDSQVIILTCMPDRFRQVGGAKVVKIEQGGV